MLDDKSKTREEVPFDRDSAVHGGYLYTTNQPLSATIAISRQTEEVLKSTEFSGKSVIDIGCGDGATTIDLYERTNPASIVGIDPAENAIKVARSRVGDRNIAFSVESAYSLPFADRHFDVAHLRGVLHHMDRPEVAVREAARVARHVVILEPNGYNPVMKLIEKVSPYHRAHGERSFFGSTIERWVRDAGLKTVFRSHCCLVPYFCPDGVARALKRIEPFVEGQPFIRTVGCGAFVIAADHMD